MSDYYVKIIPTSPQHTIFGCAVNDAVEIVKSSVNFDSVISNIYESPQFIDCGDGLETIKCPICGAELSFDWWGEAMNDAADTAFEDLAIMLPCCSNNSSLNDLKYHYPCGFARWDVSVLNPTTELSQECIKKIEEILNTSIRIIHSHI